MVHVLKAFVEGVGQQCSRCLAVVIPADHTGGGYPEGVRVYAFPSGSQWMMVRDSQPTCPEHPTVEQARLRAEAKPVQLHEDRGRQPNIYPCGCSRHKVNAGLCDQYKPGEIPEYVSGLGDLPAVADPDPQC